MHPGDGQIQIAAIEPIASMTAVENDRLDPIAERIRDLLRTAADRG